MLSVALRILSVIGWETVVTGKVWLVIFGAVALEAGEDASY